MGSRSDDSREDLSLGNARDDTGGSRIPISFSGEDFPTRTFEGMDVGVRGVVWEKTM